MSLRDELGDLLRTIGNIHIQADVPNVAVFSTPRAGSTWVMELFASQPGVKFFDEPFNVRRRNVQKAGRFREWNQLMPESGNSDEIVRYLNDLKDNRFRFMNPTPFRRHYRPFTNRVVYKIHAVKHCINAIRDGCDCDVLYLLRHPVVNTVSRNQIPRLAEFLGSNHFMSKIPAKSERDFIVETSLRGTHLQKGIISWCFENIDAFLEADKQRWTVVTYEELVLSPESIVGILAERFDFRDAARAYASVSVPASNLTLSSEDKQQVLRNSEGRSRKAQLWSKWLFELDPAEHGVCRRIMSAFGIDYYDLEQPLCEDRYLLDKDATLANLRSVKEALTADS